LVYRGKGSETSTLDKIKFVGYAFSKIGNENLAAWKLGYSSGQRGAYNFM
jgi:hypothetical protein